MQAKFDGELLRADVGLEELTMINKCADIDIVYRKATLMPGIGPQTGEAWLIEAGGMDARDPQLELPFSPEEEDPSAVALRKYGFYAVMSYRRDVVLFADMDEPRITGPTRPVLPDSFIRNNEGYVGRMFNEVHSNIVDGIVEPTDLSQPAEPPKRSGWLSAIGRGRRGR